VVLQVLCAYDRHFDIDKGDEESEREELTEAMPAAAAVNEAAPPAAAVISGAAPAVLAAGRCPQMSPRTETLAEVHS
jgi:hypothetical protein